jgi:fructose-bisphosphate aldolase/2-amino-3,7-dideoxy-D-threo-hept-6-ulosonate synthase
LSLGKARRMRRIFRIDGKTVITPMDHGVTLGPVKGLTDMQGIVDKLSAGGVDAVVLHKGIAKAVDLGNLGLILHLSASTRLSPSPNWKVRIGSVEEALLLGADAISVHINVGSEKEPEMLETLGSVADECDAWGMPLLAMMYARGPNIKNEHDPDILAHIARLGAELGADVVKCNYTGDVESFKKVVKGCPVPVVIAGGPKAETDREVLEMVYGAMKAGGKGVSIGRNVFQHDNPTAMVQAIAKIVHENASVEEASRCLISKT